MSAAPKPLIAVIVLGKQGRGVSKFNSCTALLRRCAAELQGKCFFPTDPLDLSL